WRRRLHQERRLTQGLVRKRCEWPPLSQIRLTVLLKYGYPGRADRSVRDSRAMSYRRCPFDVAGRFFEIPSAQGCAARDLARKRRIAEARPDLFRSRRLEKPPGWRFFEISITPQRV